MNESVMKAWIWPPGIEPIHLEAGLINHSVGLGIRGQLYMVLQRLNTDIFAPEVHQDIEAITQHIARKGLLTPRLVPTATGQLFHTDDEGGCWRLLTPVGDRTLYCLEKPQHAYSAGAFVARFHRATADLEHTFRFTRPGAHDTEAHFNELRLSLMTHSRHRLHSHVSRLADQLLDDWEAWQGPTGLPTRIVHGDLKISNLRFEGEEAVALIDLDTLAAGTLDIELGDALRSWCNPAGEDIANTTFRFDLFEAAMGGYATVADWSPEERAAVGPGVERICLELAARFAKDALEETYFGFDPAIGRGEHNLLRARGQASLARSVIQQRGAIQGVFRGS